MKGLIIKDFCIMSLQKRFVLLMLVAGVFLYKISPYTAILYMSFIFASIAIGTISYDQYENGMLYLLSTPVKKKEYVIEKFIVSLIMTVIGWTVSFLICLIMMIIQNEFSIEFLIISITILPIAYMVSSLQIPIKLKFEAEKSKIATMITTIFLVSLFTVIPLINMNISIVFLGILMMVLIVLFYRISIQIISKKEY